MYLSESKTLIIFVDVSVFELQIMLYFTFRSDWAFLAVRVSCKSFNKRYFNFKKREQKQFYKALHVSVDQITKKGKSDVEEIISYRT